MWVGTSDGARGIQRSQYVDTTAPRRPGCAATTRTALPLIQARLFCRSTPSVSRSALSTITAPGSRSCARRSAGRMRANIIASSWVEMPDRYTDTLPVPCALERHSPSTHS